MLRDIINTYREAVRVFVRQRTKPLTIEEAEEKRLFWSKCYAFSAFASFLLATYFTAAYRINFDFGDDDVPKSEAVLRKLADSPTRVISLKNFSKVDEYMFYPQKNEKPIPGSDSEKTSEGN